MTEREGREGEGRTSGEESEAEPQKPYGEILEEEIRQGLTELERPAAGLIMSGLSAGLDIGFSVLLMAVMLTLTEGQILPVAEHILEANMYAVGFILVVLGRSELFTEHTTLAMFPVLDGRASLLSLGRLWGMVYVANLVGAAAFAALITLVGPGLGATSPEAYGDIAGGMLGHAWWVVVLSGLLAGWLMGLMSWLTAASRDTISQVFFVWLIATAIGLAGLHHCIVGSVEVLAGMFAGQGVTLSDYGDFLLWTTLGNVLGGVIFVAIVKYSHATQGESGA